MKTLEEALRIVRDKCPDRLIRSYFEYRDEYRFVTSSGKTFVVDDVAVGLAIVKKNTGELRFESTTKIYADLYKLGDAGQIEAAEYEKAERNEKPIDLTPEQWNEMQNWKKQYGFA